MNVRCPPFPSQWGKKNQQNGRESLEARIATSKLATWKVKEREYIHGFVTVWLSTSHNHTVPTSLCFYQVLLRSVLRSAVNGFECIGCLDIYEYIVSLPTARFLLHSVLSAPASFWFQVQQSYGYYYIIQLSLSPKRNSGSVITWHKSIALLEWG